MNTSGNRSCSSSWRKHGVLGDVGDGPGADRDDRQARLQLAEDLLDGVLVGVGLPVLAGLQDDACGPPGRRR